MRNKLAILDAGAQYGKLIDRKVRSLAVESDILPLNVPIDRLRDYRAIVVSGSWDSVSAGAFCNSEIFNLGIPVFGICYGMQLMHRASGGIVEKKEVRQDGQYSIKVDAGSPLFSNLAAEQKVLLTHGDSIDAVVGGFRAIAWSDGIIAAFEDPARRLYGVQFHPETDLTENGLGILRNFLYGIAGFDGSYSMENRVEYALDYIRDSVGDRDVVALTSGGVDSTVLAALLSKALGPERVHAILVDTGFMRLNECSKVKAALRGIGLDVSVIDAAEAFYRATTRINYGRTRPLCEVVDPQQKRHIIGDMFMHIALKAIGSFERLGVVLAQGTLRPDLIESASELASGNADVIKTHHNDTPLVREWRRKYGLVEPLKDYHKDEVRELGLQLGLPESIVWRQPFPGPGLAVRVICADRPNIGDDFCVVDKKLRNHATAGISAALLPVRTVGVQGDGRSYSYVAALSGVRDWDALFGLAREIPQTIHEVNRVVYLFWDRVDGPITEITPTFLRRDVVAQLQQADDIVSNVLFEQGLMKSLSQVPVISFPVNFGAEGGRSIAIRPFITNDFMTGRAAFPGRDIPEAALERMVSGIFGISGISRVAYDITSKPPGTIEWE